MPSPKNDSPERMPQGNLEETLPSTRAEKPYSPLPLPGERPTVSQLGAGATPSDALPETVAGPTRTPSTSAGAVHPTDFGEYEILGEIARGGMGVVYKARQRRLNRTVALKMILAGQLASDTDISRFYTEAEAAAQLDHSGIVPIYEVGQHGSQHFFSMAYIDGQSLQDRLKQGPLPPREAAELLTQVADAVEFAHSKGIVHRDLKPHNILLDADGKPKVTDFGLAKRLDSGDDLTNTGDVLGTPSFMAPEQAEGKSHQLGRLVDVYSLGAVLYATLTGRPPFQAASLAEVLRQVIQQEPVAPKLLNGATPQDLDTICLKCLHKDPQRRYTSCGELHADLQHFLHGEPITARPTSQVERAWRWCQRKPLAALLLVTVAAALVTISATLVFAYSRVSSALILEKKERKNAVDAAHREREAKDEAVKAAEREKIAKTKAQQAEEDALRAKQATEVALEAADKNFSRSQMRLAQHYWLNNDVPEADQLLDRCPPDLRDWEWHYLKRLCHNELKVISDDLSFCNAVYSVDGRFLVTGGRAGIVRLWDAEKLQVTRSFSTDGLPVKSVAISANGERVAAFLPKEVLRIWNTITGERIAEIGGIKGTFRNRMRFSPDGQTIAGPAGTVCDLANSKILYRTSDHTVDHAFLPDGQLVTAEGQAIHFWDQTGKEIRSLPGMASMAMNVSPDGHWIAIALVDGVEVVDAQNGTKRFSFRAQSDSVADLCFSGDNKQIAAACGDRAVRVWDIENNRLQATLRGHGTSAPRWVSFHRDGKRLASGSQDCVSIWNAENDPETTHWQTGGSLIVVDPVRNRFITCGNGVTGIVLRDCDTGKEVCQRLDAGPVLCAAYSQDGRRLATGGPSGITVWDGETLKERQDLPPINAAVTRLTFGPDAVSLYSASADKFVRRWHIDQGKMIAEAQLPSDIYRLVQVPEAKEVALLAAGRIVLWDSANPPQRKTLSPQRVLDFAISRDGTRIATTHSYETGVHVWDSKTEELIVTLPSKYSMARVAFHPTGERVVASTSAAAPVSQAIVWDCVSGQELLVFRERGLVRFLSELTFSPRGDYLFAQGATYTRRWDARPSTEGYSLTGHGGWVHAVAYASDGKFLATGSSDGNARLWELRRGHTQAKLRSGNVPTFDVKLLANDKQMMTVSDKVRLWDLERQQQLLEYQTGSKPLNRVTISPDEQFAAIVGVEPIVRLLKIADGSPVRELKLHQDEVAGATFSHDGHWLVTVGGNDQAGEIIIWDLRTAQGVLIPQPGLVRAAAFDPRENTFITASHDGRLCLWDIQGKLKQVLQERKGERLQTLAWSRNGKRLAVGGNARVVDVWDMESQKKLAELRQPQNINGLAFSPLGDRLAIALQSDLVRIVPVD
ncbi:MAG: protein kinase domain-containing protein [Pirellulaceae bacterium]